MDIPATVLFLLTHMSHKTTFQHQKWLRQQPLLGIGGPLLAQRMMKTKILPMRSQTGTRKRPTTAIPSLRHPDQGQRQDCRVHTSIDGQSLSPAFNNQRCEVICATYLVVQQPSFAQSIFDDMFGLSTWPSELSSARSLSVRQPNFRAATICVTITGPISIAAVALGRTRSSLFKSSRRSLGQRIRS